MFWLIETDSQLQTFKDLGHTKVFVEPISLNDNIHPAENEVCALYIRGIDDSKGYLINLSHSEATNCSFREVFEMLKEFEEIFVVDKKSFMHFFLLKNLTDIHFISPTDRDWETSQILL